MNWRSYLQRSSALVAVGLLVATASGEAARAQATSIEELRRTIQLQQQQLQQQQLLLQRMQQQLDQVSAQATQAAQTAQSTQAAQQAASTQPAITFGPGARLTSPDGNFTFGIRGKLQGDAVFFKDEGDGDDPGDYDFDSGTVFRRARIGIDGTLFKEFAYRLEADFANGVDVGLSIQDAYIQYIGIPDFTLTVLQHKYPFSIENLTSDSYVTFMELPLIVNAFGGEPRRIGLSGTYVRPHWTLAAGIFGDNASVGRGNDQDPDEGWLSAARLTVAPINEPGRVLHLGANAFWQFDTQNEEVRFRDRPELRVDGSRLIDTGTLGGFGDDAKGIDNYYLLGPELAAVFGPFHVQGEYQWVKVKGDDLIIGDAGTPTGNDPTFTGWYTEAGWFLTGESRPYKNGAWERVKPRQNFSLQSGGSGAWQVAARYSTIDLRDEGIDGGEEDNITLGLNWYLNPYMTWKLNWVRFDIDNSPAVGGEDLKSWGIGTRFQIDW